MNEKDSVREDEVTQGSREPEQKHRRTKRDGVFQPTYTDKRTGELRISSVWWIQWSHRGKTHRESSKSRRRGDAVALRKLRIGQAGIGRPVTPAHHRVTFEQIAADLRRDYRVRGLRTLNTLEGRVTHLKEFFGDDPAIDINAMRVRAYQEHRIEHGARRSTINREVAALHRMMVLAVRANILPQIPVFPERLKEPPPRQGFFEHADFLAIRKHLPDDYRDVVDFAYWSGWRKSEISNLEWREVDLSDGVISLDPNRSKTGHGRILPLTGPLREVLERRRALRTPQCRLVFHRDSEPIGDWRKAWRHACRDAGLTGKRFHDFRRTAARNFIRAGVPERVAMELLGHRTRSVFDRYNIVSVEDRKEAAKRLATYIATQSTEPTVTLLKRGATG
jgi:integrase